MANGTHGPTPPAVPPAAALRENPFQASAPPRHDNGWPRPPDKKRAADAELRRKELAILRMELEVERDLQDCAHEEALAQIEQDATTDFPAAPFAQLDPGQPEDDLRDRIHEWLGDGSTAGAQLHRDDQPGLDEQSAPPATGELGNNPVQPPSQHAMLDAAMLLPLPDGDDSIADSTRYVSSPHVHVQPDQHHTPMQPHVQPPPPTSSSIVNIETATTHRGLTAVTHASTAPLSMPHPTQAISVTAAHHVATSTASRSSLPVVSPSTHVPVQHVHVHMVHAPHGSSLSGQRISHSAQSAQPPASTTTNGPRVRHAPTASSSHHAHAPPVWTTSQPAQQPSARELSLLEEVRHLQDRLARAHVDQPPTSTGGPTIAQSLQQLSATLSAAITRPTDTTHLDKLLARQGTDKALPPFSGAPEEWPVFHQLYMTTTAACGYTDAENLARLQKCLKGKAKTLVQSLLALPANVPRIISTLQMHYGRTDLIIETLIQQVQTLPPVEETNLIDFAVAVQNLVSTIESANATAHLQNPQLRKDPCGTSSTLSPSPVGRETRRGRTGQHAPRPLLHMAHLKGHCPQLCHVDTADHRYITLLAATTLYQRSSSRHFNTTSGPPTLVHTSTATEETSKKVYVLRPTTLE